MGRVYFVLILMLWTLDDVKASRIPRGFVGPLLPYFMDSKNPHQPMNIYKKALENASTEHLNEHYAKQVVLPAKKPEPKHWGWADTVRKHLAENPDYPKQWVLDKARELGIVHTPLAMLRGQRFIPAGRFIANRAKKYVPKRLVDNYKRIRALKTVVSKMKRNAVPWLVTGITKGKWMYPGVNYIGPGNKLNEGKPVSYHDRLAYVHDHQYDYLQKKGINPYFTFNEADREMIRNVDTRNDEGMAEWIGMNAKRIFKSNREPVPVIQPWEVKYGGAAKPRQRPRRSFNKSKFH